MKELPHLLKKLQTDPAQARRMGPPKNFEFLQSFEFLGRAMPAVRARSTHAGLCTWAGPLLARGPAARLAYASGIYALRLPLVKLQGSRCFL